MGMRIHKRFKLGKKTSVNVSKRGISFSQKLGKFMTINSRGSVTFSLPKTGLSYHIKIKKYLKH